MPSIPLDLPHLYVPRFKYVHNNEHTYCTSETVITIVECTEYGDACSACKSGSCVTCDQTYYINRSGRCESKPKSNCFNSTHNLTVVL